jgi:hypothetical protein
VTCAHSAKRGAQVRALQGGGWQADAGRFRTYAAAVLGLAGAQVRLRAWRMAAPRLV